MSHLGQLSRLGKLRTWYRQSATPVLALRSFTALLGVKPGQQGALSDLLAELDAAQNRALASVQGLHNMRWLSFTPSEKTAAGESGAPKALLLNLAFDGELDDLLGELMVRVRDDVLAVLRNCEGFHDESADPIAYLKRREVPSGFVYREIGPLDPKLESAKVADATLAELQSAAGALTDFVDFYREHPPVQFERNAGDLMKEFLERFDVPRARGPLHPLEERQSEEERWVRLASELMQRKQRRVARRSNDGVVRRAAHAKAHGLVHAKFKVCKSELAVGLFQREGREFNAVLRSSNSADSVTGDRKRDARGIAISLDLSGLEGRWLGEPGRQDFLLFDHPVFMAPDVQGLVRLLALLELSGWRRRLWHAARFLASRGGLKQLSILARTLLSRPRHPLRPTFHSAVPYQLGQDHVVKYSVAPSDPASLPLSPDMLSDEYLSSALESSLEKSISLDFFVHALPVSGGARSRRAVEDATLDWSRLGARRVKVATIEIGRQSQSLAARTKQAEEWAFNPWNALEEHRPLGSLNRARRTAYRDGAANRAAARTPPSFTAERPPPSETSPDAPDIMPVEADREPDSKAAE